MRNIVALIIFLAAATGPLVADDRDIAHSYFLKARELADRGAPAGARELLAESIDLYPGYSETLFLLGKIDVVSQETTARGVSLMEKALKLNTWSVTPAMLARESIAYVYLRTKRFKEALALLSDLRRERITSPEIETAYARTAAGLGDFALAEQTFTTAERTYPSAAGIMLAHLRLLKERKADARARVIMERGLKEFPGEPRFLYYQLALSRDPGKKAALFDAYVNLGGADPRVILFLLDADQKLFKQAVEFSVNHRGNENVMLLEALGAALRTDKAKRAAAQALFTLTGDMTVDADEDGFFEEKYIVRDAKVERALFDRDQNGLIEMETGFTDNRPTEIIMRQANGRETRFVFNIYPRVAKVLSNRGDDSRSYDLIPDRLLLAPFKALPAPQVAKFRVIMAPGFRFPDESEALTASWALTETPSDKNAPRRQWELFSGRKLVLHEDADWNGAFERTVIYDAKGTPLRGLVDADGDGQAELHEVYERGLLVRRELDADRDGKPEYSENDQATGRSWDLDGDGVIDIRERRLPNGTPVFEFLGKYRKK
jgi:tetratricopeptide (TPR) repeat protein